MSGASGEMVRLVDMFGIAVEEYEREADLSKRKPARTALLSAIAALEARCLASEANAHLAGQALHNEIERAEAAEADRDRLRAVVEAIRIARDGWTCGDLSEIAAFDRIDAALASEAT